MRRFGWLSAGDIPIDIDLRRCGWQRVDDWRMSADAGTVLLANRASIDAAGWVELLGDTRVRRQILLVGVNDDRERARLLQLGFGEVLDDSPTLTELDARAVRVERLAAALPRHRDLGNLRLDLFHRDGFVRGKRLGLHPREFGLLWRLSETPDRSVSQNVLLADVWQMFHSPETNRIAVHIFRLRAKLAAAGLEGLVRTAADGSYFFAADNDCQEPPIVPPMRLDAGHGLSEDALIESYQDLHNETALQPRQRP